MMQRENLTEQMFEEAEKVRVKTFKSLMAAGAYTWDELYGIAAEEGIATRKEVDSARRLTKLLFVGNQQIKEHAETYPLSMMRQYAIDIVSAAKCIQSFRDDLRGLPPPAEYLAAFACMEYLITESIVDGVTGDKIYQTCEEFMEHEELNNLKKFVWDTENQMLHENATAWLITNGFADAQGRLMNEYGDYVDEYGRRVSPDGQFLNDKGELIDEDGRPVEPPIQFEPFLDEDGTPIKPKTETQD